MGITNSGYVTTSEEEYYNLILDELKITFPLLSENYANVVIILARMIARNESRRDNEVANLYNQAYVATATGLSLDKCGYAYGLPRLEGTRANGTVRITKTAGTTSILLPAYAQIKSSDLVYQCNNDLAITITGGTYDIGITSIDTGSDYNISVDSTFIPVSVIPNIDSVVAITSITGGSDTESDFEYRERLFYAQQSSKNSSLQSVISQIKNVSGVEAVLGYENTSHTEVNSMKPHSISIYVGGGTDEDIATALVKAKAGGIYTNGDITKTVQINGYDYTVSFFRLSEVPVYYNITVSVNSRTVPSNIENIIKDRIVLFTKNKSTIKTYDLVGDIAQADDSIYGVMDYKLDIVNPPINTSHLVSGVGEFFVIDSSKIVVTIVTEIN